MSLPITRTTRVTKTAHAASLAAGLVAATVVLALAVTYGPAVVHLFHRVFVQVGTGGSKISNLGIDAVFATVIGVIVLAIGLAVRERRADEDKEIFDVR